MKFLKMLSIKYKTAQKEDYNSTPNRPAFSLPFPSSTPFTAWSTLSGSAYGLTPSDITSNLPPSFLPSHPRFGCTNNKLLYATVTQVLLNKDRFNPSSIINQAKLKKMKPEPRSTEDLKPISSVIIPYVKGITKCINKIN